METIRRVHLADQVADQLRRELRSGRWTEWLPSERLLSASFQVNRRTLRQALAALQREGLLQAVPRKGYRIGRTGRRRRVRTKTPVVAVLMSNLDKPQPLEFAEVLTAFQNRCLRDGFTLQWFQGRQYFRRTASNALTQLVRANPADCWILRTSDERLHRWFVSQHVPAVVWGRCNPDLPLPSVAVDVGIPVRHAVGLLLGRGHRRIALLVQRSVRSHQTRDMFIRSIAQSGHDNAQFQVWEHGLAAEDIREIVRRGMAEPAPPTAVLVSRAMPCVTLLQILQQQGLAVPEKVSVISRDYAPVFDYLRPRPCCYRFPSQAFASALFERVNRITHGDAISAEPHFILPELLRGDTVG